MTPTEIWPILAGGAAIVFGAGQLVEKIRNGKFVTREFCGEHRKNEDEKWTQLIKSIDEIKTHLGMGRIK
jgi:hypothetical protein